MSHTFPQEFRYSIYERDGYRCLYCQRDIYPDTDDPRHHASLDHVLPRSMRGTHEATNVVACCISCNSSKRHKDVFEFASAETVTRIMATIRLPLRAGAYGRYQTAIRALAAARA